jgi:hypothetical protein
MLYRSVIEEFAFVVGEAQPFYATEKSDDINAGACGAAVHSRCMCHQQWVSAIAAGVGADIGMSAEDGGAELWKGCKAMFEHEYSYIYDSRAGAEEALW